MFGSVLKTLDQLIVTLDLPVMCRWFCWCCLPKKKKQNNGNGLKTGNSPEQSPDSQKDSKGRKNRTVKKKVQSDQIVSFYDIPIPPDEDKSNKTLDRDYPSTSTDLANYKITDTYVLPDHELHLRTIPELMASKGYEFHTQVGKGGFGIVRKCYKIDAQTGMKKVLAVKEIYIPMAKKERMIRNLKTEIFVLKKCKHPYIIGLEDHFIVHTRSKSMAFLFMEFADCDTLQQEINYGPIANRVAKRFFAQTATALTYLHRLKIAHKDLKPENILLITNEKTGMKDIRLGDFGLSANVYKPKEGIIKPGHFGGTRGYMAPEILRLEVYKEHRKMLSLGYDPFKSDMWALGVCLFEMFTKCLPFEYHNLNNMLALQEERNFSYPRGIKDSIDPNADNLIRLLLEPDVTKRLDPLGVLIHPWLKDEVDFSLIKPNVATK